MEKIKARLFLILLFILVAGFFCFPLSVSAEKMSHTVKKGDTLWDICEYYYGDNSLWPKLWEMNSFITNPHLLIPGDVITLFEKGPQKTPEPEPKPEPEPEPEPAPIMGIDIEGIVHNSNRVGFYSSKKNIVPWGILFAAADKHLIHGKDDIVYVIFEEGKKVTIGSEFAVGKLSQVKHPITKKKAGNVFNVSGRLVIEKKAGLAYKDNKTYEKENSYQAKILESYDPIEIGDILMPTNNISKCVLPVSNNRDILANIVIGANEQTLIHKYSIIYMDKGRVVTQGSPAEIQENLQIAAGYLSQPDPGIPHKTCSS